jgi:hypothetical protein
MYETTVFAIDPAGVTNARFVALAMLGVVSVVCLGLVARLGWHSWWAVIAAAIGLPTIVVAALGGAMPDHKWPLPQYILDIVIPLALLGLPAAAIGSAVGAMLRWLAHRTSI